MMEDRLRPPRRAELAAYVHWEYGPHTGPEFILAEIADGGAWGPRRRRRLGGTGFLAGLSRVVRALVGNARKARIPESAK